MKTRADYAREAAYIPKVLSDKHIQILGLKMTNMENEEWAELLNDLPKLTIDQQWSLAQIIIRLKGLT